jgi:hypothetical protein
MAPLERIARNLRAVLAPHVPLQFVDGRCPRPADDIQRHRNFDLKRAAPARPV